MYTFLAMYVSPKQKDLMRKVMVSAASRDEAVRLLKKHKGDDIAIYVLCLEMSFEHFETKAGEIPHDGWSKDQLQRSFGRMMA